MEQLAQAPVTVSLIVANILISVAAWQSEPMLNRGLFHIAPMRQAGQWDRAVTSGFLHGNGAHLFMNMYVLWVFGSVLEHPQVLGSVNYAIVYAVALIGGSAWSYMENFRNPNYRALGASGAVSGIVLSFCMFAPLATLSLFFAIPMPAVIFAVGFIAVSAMLAQNENKIIGHEAHLGGALAGAVMTIILVPEVWPSFISQVSRALGMG